jgi:hypothetical protein
VAGSSPSTKWGVTVAAHEGVQLLVADAGEDGRVGDLVAVEMEDGQHGPVAGGVEELVALPAGRQRPRLRLAVADDAGHDQVRVVECGPVGVRKRVAQLAALVDAARSLRRHVRRDAAGERELGEEPLQARLVPADVGVDLAVRALQVGVGHHGRPAVPRTGDEEHAQVALLDDPVEVGVE